MYKYLILLLFFAPIALSAQVTISGKVTSLVNKKGVADATVFLSNTRAGTKTDNDGSFSLYGVKDGKYDMVVSCIGYEKYYKQITVKYNDIKLSDIELIPRVNQLHEVNIRPAKKIKRDYKRENQVRTFTDEFLGRTANASQCKILNSEVLIFEDDEKTFKFTATTNDFLIIENKALGYRIKYLVKSFLIDRLNGIISYTGSSVFEALPGNEIEQAVWQKNRTAAYKGSTMHFLRSCIADATSGNNFYAFGLNRRPTGGRLSDSVINAKIRELTTTGAASQGTNSLAYYKKELSKPQYEQWADEKPLVTAEYTKLTDEKGIYALEYGKILMVNYKHRQNGSNSRTSYIAFIEPDIYFDSNGVIFTPKSAMISGYWATLRVGDLLPVDYEPGK
ncbi:hypothetical protein ACVW0P_002209 [Mucilaginibacter sp. UYNi724]